MTTIRKFIYVLGFLCLITRVEGQESIQQNYDPSGATTFRLENLNGSVKIVGTESSTLSMEVRLTPSEYEVDVPEYEAPKPSFTFSQKGETLFLNIILPEEETNHDFWREPVRRNPWGSDWWDNSGVEPAYAYQMDFTLKVPKSLNLMVSTMHNGDIHIREMNGKLDVKNQHGDIRLEDVQGRVRTKTFHGDISVSYLRNPTEDSFFKTFNGEIFTRFQKGVAARMTFLSRKGEFFTNLPELEYKQQEVTKKKGMEGSGVSYKIQRTASVISREGTVALHFETYNGDVYAKE